MSVNRAAVATATTSNVLVYNGTTTTTSSSVFVSPCVVLSARHSSSAPQTEEPASSSSSQGFVSVLKLNMLQQNPGASKKKRRVGRGIGSSKGKTSGRGHKGTKARSGGSVPLFFEGGQTPFYKLLPKRGFTNKRHKTDMVSLNVGTIQDYIDMGRLSLDNKNENNIPVFNMKDLLDAGMFTTSSVKHGIKLLAEGKERLKTPFKLEISRVSESAIDAVEAIGGEVTTVHYNRLALRALLKPHKFTANGMKTRTVMDRDDEGGYGFEKEEGEDATVRNNSKTPRALPKFARPPPKWQPYYTSWKNRGYLSVQAQMRKLISERPELEDKFARALGVDNNSNKVEENQK
eukprot:CAMPEP_0168191588 /NCGR_PEP_ID=MMETSP0139_2-20121125/17599_1 /TAXON_ID=44445 /ORGANISM="Pseudo-nitzschia australis, Strain 10249 10 AB" /LENGTH=346 /DNA_ID=CAMNT_0008114779 /DNA_START=117 /DNA_END=1157 /DNA_ORIENTATION=-